MIFNDLFGISKKFKFNGTAPAAAPPIHRPTIVHGMDVF